MSRKRLIRRLLRRSESKHWPHARQEWTVHHIWRSDDYRTCLCGHYPIRELCILENELNGTHVVVGNCCVRAFVGLPSGKMFAAVRKRRINSALIDLAYRRKIINTWERDFSLDTWRKRKLTDKQRRTRDHIADKILSTITN